MDDDAILEAALRFAASKGDSEPESIECVRDASSMKAVHLFSGGGIYEGTAPTSVDSNGWR
jgi:hypothetical protein